MSYENGNSFSAGEVERAGAVDPNEGGRVYGARAEVDQAVLADMSRLGGSLALLGPAL
jgi:hypothetical protein